MLIFPKSKTIILKEKIFSLVFGLNKDLLWSYIFSLKMRNYGYVVLYDIWKSILKMILDFWEVNLTKIGLASM